MPVREKVVPFPPNYSSSSSSKSHDSIVLSSFKLKSVGTSGARNTLVENDSLSSYSWPEETSNKHGANRQSGNKIRSRFA